MRLFLFTLGFLIGYILGDNTAHGSPLNIDYLAMEGSQFESNRDPYTPNTSPSEYSQRAGLRWNVSAWGVAYWDNWCHTETSRSGGIKTAGWQWEAGLHVTPWLDAFKSHHSRHVVEEHSEVRWKNSSGRFPVEDSYGLRFIIVPNSERRTIFD